MTQEHGGRYNLNDFFCAIIFSLDVALMHWTQLEIGCQIAEERFECVFVYQSVHMHTACGS